jgi:hypothetical protein
MKKHIFLLLLICFSAAGEPAAAQCSICTRSAQQLGERPAKALNAGIMYLAFAPMAILGIIGFRWWKQNQASESN